MNTGSKSNNSHDSGNAGSNGNNSDGRSNSSNNSSDRNHGRNSRSNNIAGGIVRVVVLLLPVIATPTYQPLCPKRCWERETEMNT